MGSNPVGSTNNAVKESVWDLLSPGGLYDFLVPAYFVILTGPGHRINLMTHFTIVAAKGAFIQVFAFFTTGDKTPATCRVLQTFCDVNIHSWVTSWYSNQANLYHIDLHVKEF
jgi:hypothetical protein